MSFHGVRITARTKRPFEEVLDRLRAQMGKASIHEIVRLAHDSPDEQAYAREIEARFVGKSGFMIFHEIDHGWIARFGIRERVLRIILGNPLVAITMLREDLSAGLFVPVEVLVAESAEAGTNLTYVQPSTLIAVDPDNAALRAAAAVLDAKLAAMVEVVFGE
jgi:uncharacterized protein (DUF302 family)